MGKGSRCLHTWGAIATVMLGAAGVEPATAGYFYTPVADSRGPLGTQLADYALGNNGHVAFANMRDDGQNSINRWNGSSLQTVAETGSAVPGWALALNGVGINASGQVSYIGVRVASQTELHFGAYRGEVGSAVTTISEVALSQPGPGYLIGSDINAAGTVAYQRRVTGTSRGIYTRNGPAGTEQTIYVAADTDNLGFWSINNAGHVAISGTIGGVTGVWKGTGNGTLTPIATGNFTQVRTPVIDDAGNVTFGATLSNGTLGIYRGNGSGGLTTLADSTAVFSGNFARTSANNDGDAAFMANPAAGGLAIYFLPAGANAADAQEVIAVGDSLFGLGNVEALLLAPRSLNDADQVAFMYRLANETWWGLAVATVPEPASLALLGLGAAGLLARRRRNGR